MANLPTLPTLPTQAILHKGSSSVGNSVGNSNLPTSPQPLPSNEPVGNVSNNVGNSNLPTSHKPLHSKDCVGNVGNVGKNSPSSSKGDQLSLLPDDQDVPKPTNHYQLEDGDQDEF